MVGGIVMFCLTSLLVLLKPCHGVSEINESLIVQTSLGPIQGYNFTSPWTNQTIYAFQGIPYAAPPVGDLRFKDPVPPEKWTSVINCTKDQDSCMQPLDLTLAQLNLTFNMSENCLFINVYTPKLSSNVSLPVMVWVHGGGFILGSGSRFRYGPDLLVAEDVIVVTFNYRLGAFGFLNLGTSGIPGNMALKDQRLALQWVQREISQFGGDAGNVTLFGESAGSACVHLHYLSPLSKGLFHRVIGESGTSLGWAVEKNATRFGLNLASNLNCSTTNTSDTQKCLLAASAEDIIKAQMLVKMDPWDTIGLAFVPTLDNATSKEPFIPDLPTNMIKKKLGSFVPFVMGINAQEGIMMLPRGDDVINNITNNLVNFIPMEVRSVSSPSRIKQLVGKIQNFYFRGTNIPSQQVKGYIDLYTDSIFGYNTAVSAKYFRERSPVYLYDFVFDGKFKEGFAIELEAKYNISGVCHAEEMSYLFVRSEVNQTAAADSREVVTWKRMVRLWTNFAKFGTPTVGADPLLQNVSWVPVGQVSTRYLRINDNLTMELQDFQGPSVALWDSITPNSGYLMLPSVVVLVTFVTLIV